MARTGAGALTLLAVTLCLGCSDYKKKTLEKQKARDDAQKVQLDKDEAKKKAAVPKIDRAKLDAPWDGPDFVKVQTGKPCPDGMWSLFKETPGESDADKADNEKKRADFLEKMKGTTFYAILPQGTGVTLGKYNPKKKQLPVEVDGAMECFDKLGLLTLAWGEPAKTHRPTEEEAESLSPQAVWRAKPVNFSLPFDTAAEAKSFAEKEGLGLEARVVFTVGKTADDKKVVKSQPDEDGKTGAVDWGAGRLVHVKPIGFRLAVDFEKHPLAEQLKK
jgi:hypothetical protein